MSVPGPVEQRRVLLLTHPGRPPAHDVAAQLVAALSTHGIQVRLLADEAAALGLTEGTQVELAAEGDPSSDCELVVVIGGDGTILRAAEVAHESGTPILGVNLGHVGFLAEAEYDDVSATIDAIVERRYTAEERLTIDVAVFREGELLWRTFALNEASVEKAARERMLEVVVEIDDRPLSRWGCDGVVCATPTGSTAYNFSAGGPIVWPGVEALLMVPISAHALFARSLVVAPTSVLAIEVIAPADASGVLWCDGRRSFELPWVPASRYAVASDRSGWCGSTRRRSPTGWWRSSGCRSRAGGVPASAAGVVRAVLEELRITGLGVIDSATLELGPGLTVITGETGAGKTMVVTALGLLLGGRADSGAVRAGSRSARVEGSLSVAELPHVVEAVEASGGEVEDAHVLIARNVSAEGRSRAYVGGASVPVSRLAEVTEPLVAVHGQSDQHRLLMPRAQREALDAYGGAATSALAETYHALYVELQETERELSEVTASARERAREADLLRFGLAEIEAVDPQPGEDVSLAEEEQRLGHADALRTAAGSAREALSSDEGNPDALAAVSAARALLESVRDHDAAAGELSDRIAEITYLLSDVAADVASYADGLDADPTRLAAVSERRAALTTLTRKYGETAAEVLAWAEASASRLAALDDTDDRIGRLRERRDDLVDRLAPAAEALSSRRAELAETLSVQLSGELASLAMPHARLEVAVRRTPAVDGLTVAGERVRFGPTGIDEVELLLAANTGAELRPLAKGASGGELSRVMLALEVALAGTVSVPTFVFDEVDSGVGGKAAVEVGRRLAALAATAQVLVVTHLPQVAAYADRHVVVEKASDGSVTTSGLTVLDAAGRERELSRMFAGMAESETALAHARELLEAAGHG